MSNKEKFFLDNTTNPYTGRKIQIHGPTYKKLVKEFGDPISQQFLNDPSINPLTGRKIKIGGYTYQKIK